MNRIGGICVVFIFLVVVDRSNANLLWKTQKLVEESQQVKPTPVPQIRVPSSPDPNLEKKPSEPTDRHVDLPKSKPNGSDNSTDVKPLKVPEAKTGENTPDVKVLDPEAKEGDNRSDPLKVPQPKGEDNTPEVKVPEPQVPDGKVPDQKVDEKRLDDKVPETKGEGERKELDPKVPVPKIGSEVEKDLNLEEAGENCKKSSNRCTAEKMTACLQRGSQQSFIVIQNEGDTILKVDVSVPDSVKLSASKLEIPEHKVEKINASVNVGGSHEIRLKVGSGVCMLHIGVPTPETKSLQWISSYANNLVTPVYGAYFILALTLLIGSTWACCKFVKRRRHGNGGVPYQELEMGLPESSPAVNADSLDGWDQGWDSDWDEERAVRSPGHRVGSVSANGLTSRSTNKDGWENDWDD